MTFFHLFWGPKQFRSNRTAYTLILHPVAFSIWIWVPQFNFFLEIVVVQHVFVSHTIVLVGERRGGGVFCGGFESIPAIRNLCGRFAICETADC